ACAAAVDVGLAAVLDDVRAGRRRACLRGVVAYAARAVGGYEAAFGVGALGRACAAAVDVGLRAVLHGVRARRRRARERARVADAGGAVGLDEAALRVGALGGTRAAAVDVGLVAVLDAVGARRGRALLRDAVA